MRYRLEIGQADIAAIHKLMDDFKSHPFVQARQAGNVAAPPPANTRERFWVTQFMCLLTTQNKSGAGSSVDKFLSEWPFPLAWDVCQSTQDVDTLIYDTLSKLRIRRWKISSSFAQQNFRVLNDGGWERLENWNRRLLAQRKQDPIPDHYRLEREAAQDLQFLLKGIGPKQSRNFWQDMGLTRYEIPLDSRIMRWFTRYMDFYVPANGLSDERFYCQVMDTVNELALAADILPCMLDAAVFASFERQ